MMILFLLFSCSENTDTCNSANDGICDELSTCALGTDSTDCDSICSEKPWPRNIAGICAHDYNGLPPKSLRENPQGTLGTGGKTGTIDDVVRVRGAQADVLVDRHFRIYVPRRYNPERATPVLFALGGFSVDMYWLAEFTELSRLADREEIIIVYGHPEWRNFGTYDVFSWYSYKEAYEGDWIDNPDIAYMEAISFQLSEQYNIDPSRIFVSGHSRGGALSMIAAFERPDLFAGFCAQAGFVRANDYDLRIAELAPYIRPAAYLVHGDADPDVSVGESDAVSSLLQEAQWEYNEEWFYQRIPKAKHEWQTQYNQDMWDFLYEHPIGESP
jgi:poly(3-hydroxybutyrate) depolymerase